MWLLIIDMTWHPHLIDSYYMVEKMLQNQLTFLDKFKNTLIFKKFRGIFRFKNNSISRHNRSHNFEKLFSDAFRDIEYESQPTYLPIQWTNYLVKNNYGKNINSLQKFCNHK